MHQPRTRWFQLGAPLGCLALLVTFLTPAPAALAGNGHFTHGVGAINSAMGGVGTGMSTDLLGALARNPALLTQYEGYQMAFGIELVQSDSSVSSTVQTPFGPFSGTTEGESDLSPIPTVGWSYKPDGGSVAFGFGFLGLAGFSTDYPQDPTNPILAPQPQGFGRVQADYSVLHIPFAVAWQVHPKLSLGASLNGAWATLEATPFGAAGPDCSGPSTCFFPAVDRDGAFGVGLQAGLHYQIDDAWSVGLSYSTEQSFEDFSWNATVANPDLPTFGTGREVRFNLNVPQIASAGLGFEPSDRLSLGLDARWINYSDTDGFRGGPVDLATLVPPGLGWEDIWVVGIGGEYTFPGGVALRLGYNLSEAAVPDEAAFFNVQSPANFEDHYTAGLGFPVGDKLQVNLGYYHVPSNEVAGPFQTPLGPLPGTRVANEISVDSYLMSFTFDL